MTPEATELVRQSWAQAGPRALEVVVETHGRILALDPRIRRMFANVHLSSLQERVAEELGVAVRHLDEPELLIPRVAGLGRQHQAYGVTSRHYELLGEALLESLAAVMGPRWTPEMETAWGDAYRLITSVMQRASARASGGFAVIAK